MKIKFARFVVAFIVMGVFVLAGLFLWRLTNVLQPHVASEAVKSADDFKLAFEMLNASQTSWLSVIGFFGTIFGLVLPAGAYLLQRMASKEDMQDVRDKYRELVGKCDALRQEVEVERKRLDEEGKRMRAESYFAIARNDERILFDDATSILTGKPKNWMDLANFILQFEHTLDAYVRSGKTGDCLRVIGCGRQVSQHVSSHRKAEWECAVTQLQRNRSQFVGLLNNGDLAKVLHEHPAELSWIQQFFRHF